MVKLNNALKRVLWGYWQAHFSSPGGSPSYLCCGHMRMLWTVIGSCVLFHFAAPLISMDKHRLKS